MLLSMTRLLFFKNMRSGESCHNSVDLDFIPTLTRPFPSYASEHRL
jgi:hypothetical protein